jgi:hypothetical protein
MAICKYESIIDRKGEKIGKGKVEFSVRVGNAFEHAGAIFVKQR